MRTLISQYGKELYSKFPNIVILLFTFLFMCILVRGHGMTNADSRFATMQAMSDSLTFKIDDYVDWTIDWSKIDGHYYSNKAPGPMLLGFPVYFIITKTAEVFNQNNTRKPPSSSVRSLLNLFIQVLPIFIFYFWMSLKIIKDMSISKSGIYIGLILILFGNTSSLFYNSFFGHGLAATFSVGFLFFLLKQDYFKVGLFYGLALLCDYGAALYLIPMVFFIGNLKNWKDFILGGIFPALLWSLYHLNVTGSLVTLPNKYINPVFKVPEEKLLWNMFSYPQTDVAIKLLLGPKKGILYTQPWVLLLIPVLLINIFKEKNKRFRSVFVITFIGFALVFLMNTSFNGWHGGATSGPRYLSISLVQLAFCMMIIWENLSFIVRSAFLVLIAYTLLFRSLIFATTPMISENLNLLPSIFKFLKTKAGLKQFIRIPIFLGLISLSLLFKSFHKKILSMRMK